MVRLRLPSQAVIVLVLIALHWLAVTPAAASEAARNDVNWSGETEDRVISFDDNEYARFIQLWSMVDEVYALWAEDSPSVREILFGYSGDNGQTWTCEGSDRVISFPDGHAVWDKPSFTIGDGTLLAAWSEDVTDTREIHFGISTDRGQTWSCEAADHILSDPASVVDASPPSAAIDDHGVFHVVWAQNSTGTSEVHYARSADRGQSWNGGTGDRIISFADNGNAIAPEIVVHDRDLLVVVWRETGEEGLPVVHGGRSTDGGLTWSSETADLEISPPASLMTNLAVDASTWGTDVHVVYTASYDTESPYHYEVYGTSSFDGLSWSGQNGLTPVSFDEDHSRSASNPDVFVGSCGVVIAAWDEAEDAAGTNEIHYSVWNGGTWDGAASDQILSFPDGEDGYRPSIAGERHAISLRGLSDVHVAWTEFAGGSNDNYEVHYSITPDLCSAGATPEASDLPRSPLTLSVRPNPAATDVQFGLRTRGPARIDIFDASGRLVRTLAGSGGVPAGPGGEVDHLLSWNRRDQRGRLVAPGVYLARSPHSGLRRTVVLY